MGTFHTRCTRGAESQLRTTTHSTGPLARCSLQPRLSPPATARSAKLGQNQRKRSRETPAVAVTGRPWLSREQATANALTRPLTTNSRSIMSPALRGGLDAWSERASARAGAGAAGGSTRRREQPPRSLSEPRQHEGGPRSSAAVKTTYSKCGESLWCCASPLVQ